MPTHNYAPLFGRRMRVTQLNGDGTVGTNMFVTKGFISVSLTGESEDGQEIIQRTADGELCINEQLSPTFKRLSGSVQFCGVNPTLLSWMSNAQAYQDHAGDDAGFFYEEGPIVGNFALELFTGLAGSLNDPNANGYMLLPMMTKGMIADIEINGEDAVNFTVENMLSVSGNQWGVGPYDVLMDELSAPAPLPTALSSKTHFLLIDSAAAAPALTPEPVPVA